MAAEISAASLRRKRRCVRAISTSSISSTTMPISRLGDAKRRDRISRSSRGALPRRHGRDRAPRQSRRDRRPLQRRGEPDTRRRQSRQCDSDQQRCEAIITDMQALMTGNPLLFGGLTGVHAEAVVRQLELENAYIAQAGVNPDAGRASNDNILDIIDIIQGDTNLANMANQGGVSGFTPFGDRAEPNAEVSGQRCANEFLGKLHRAVQFAGTTGDHDRHRSRCGGDCCRDRRPPRLPDGRHQLRRRAGRHLRGAVRQRVARRYEYARSRGGQR